jgi:hypothetical protein
MREDNLLCVRRRKFVVTTDSDHGQSAKMYPASEWRMFSGRMMMIRACLSLLIATVVQDLVTPQVFRHVF